jgi:hypothetical protein
MLIGRDVLIFWDEQALPQSSKGKVVDLSGAISQTSHLL